MDLSFLNETTYFGNTIGQYLFFLIVIMGSYLIGKTLYYFFKHELRKLTAKTRLRYDDLLIDIIERPLVVVVMIIGLNFGFASLTFGESVDAYISTLLSIFVSLTVLWFAIRLTDTIVTETLSKKGDVKLNEKRANNILPIARRIAKFIVLIIGLLAIASNYGYDITAVITGLGIGGLALALAAQSTLGNLFGGFSLATDRVFSIGDRIKIGEVYGDVIDIGARSCRIKTLDNTIMTIPNSKVADSIVENFSKPDARIRQKFTLGLVYGTLPEGVEKAVQLIREAIVSTDGVAPKEPDIFFTEFGQSSLSIFCTYWIMSLSYWGSTKHEINMKILKSFAKAKIEMAYPTQTVYLKK